MANTSPRNIKQAAKVLLQIEVRSKKARRKTVSQHDQDALLKKVEDHYDCQTSPYYAAARLWVDAIIDPRESRDWISAGIEAASHAEVEKLTWG